MKHTSKNTLLSSLTFGRPHHAKIIAASFLLALSGTTALAHPTFAEGEMVTVNFEDANLCSQTVSQMAITYGDDFADNCSDDTPSITANNADIAAVTSLYFERHQAEIPIFTSLVGLEHFSNLESLSIANHKVSDLTPLANLTKLQSLEFQNNQVSDLTPLTNLTDLTFIDLTGNRVSDITPLLAHSIPFGYHGVVWGNLVSTRQASTDITNSEVYELPSLYQAANSTLETPSANGWAEALLPGVLELENATMNPDGRSITITDLSRPATITIRSSGSQVSAAARSTHTVTYVEPELEPEPEPEPEPGDAPTAITSDDASTGNSTIATPNTGTSTEQTVNSTALSCIIAAITTALFFSIRHFRRQNRHQSDPLLEVPNQFHN